MRCVAVLLLSAVTAIGQDKVTVFAEKLHEPFGMDFWEGGLVCTEYGGHRVIHFDRDGKWSVLVGSGKKGFADGVGKAAEFNAPHNLVTAPGGAMYVADTMNHRVRKIDPKSKQVITIAGGDKGFAGDGGPAVEAKFDQAYHVALDAGASNLYVCDLGNRRIRKIDLKAGTIVTVAGNGTRGVPKDGATAVEAPLVDPRACVVDSAGRLWILERGGHALRVVENGKIRTVVGTGEKGFSGDGGPGTKATMNGPKFLWVDPQGNIMIADTENHCIRTYDVKTGMIQLTAGTGKKGHAGVGEPLKNVQLNRPHAMAFAADGSLFIADSDNHRILKTAK